MLAAPLPRVRHRIVNLNVVETDCRRIFTGSSAEDVELLPISAGRSVVSSYRHRSNRGPSIPGRIIDTGSSYGCPADDAAGGVDFAIDVRRGDGTGGPRHGCSEAPRVRNWIINLDFACRYVRSINVYSTKEVELAFNHFSSMMVTQVLARC